MTLTIAAPPAASWRLVDALHSLMVPTRREGGCIGCRLELSNESGDPSRIWYVEDWSSEETLREQLRSDRFPRLLALMEDALDPPHIEFQFDDGVRGLDYVEEVRAELSRKVPRLK